MKRILLILLTVTFSLGMSAQFLENNAISKIEQKPTISAVPQVSAKYFPVGYCYSDVEIKAASGFSQPYIDYEAFAYIKLPASMMKRYVGDKISAINVGFADDLRDMTVFIREDITKEDIASKTTDVELGWNEVVLDNPVIIENKDYYVGYRGTIPAATLSAVILATAETENAMMLKDGGVYLDYTTHLGKNLTWAIQALLEGNETHFMNNAKMIKERLNKYQKINTTVEFPFYFKNLGKNDIEKIEVSCFYGDKVIKKEYDVDCKFENEFRVDFEFEITNIDKVKFKITKINDVQTDIFMLEKEFILYEDKGLVARKVLIERFTTEECRNCPLATARLTKLLNDENLNNKVVSVSHHVGSGEDKYTIETSKDLLRFFGDGGAFSPAMMLDRTIFEGYVEDIKSPMSFMREPKELKEYFDAAFSVPCLTTIKIDQENATVNTTNDVKIKVSGQYNGKVPNEELFVSVYIIENGLKSDTQLGANESYIENYTHDNVIRKMLNGSEGTKIEWNGNKYEVVVEGKLDASWKKENLKVVAFVSKSSKNKLNNTQVLNAEEQKLEVKTGLNSVYAQSLNVFVRNNKVVVDGNYTSVKIFTIDGKEILNRDLQFGTYLVKISNGTDFAVKKVVVK